MHQVDFIVIFQVLHVDEIKFEQPVYIDEIRVLPTGYNVNNFDRAAIRVGYDTSNYMLTLFLI